MLAKLSMCTHEHTENIFTHIYWEFTQQYDIYANILLKYDLCICLGVLNELIPHSSS